MRVLLICGPWGSGTTAVAGLAARLGAVDFGRRHHLLTNDPQTPDSYEFLPFRKLVLEHADEPTISLRPSGPETVQAGLRLLRQRIERQEFGAYDVGGAPWVIFKYPLAALLLPQICEVFETKLVYVVRPLDEIEQTRRRRGWSAYFGAAGATVIYRHMSDLQRTRAYPTMTIAYADLLASPMQHAGRLARFVGLEPTPAQMQQAAAFVIPRTPQAPAVAAAPQRGAAPHRRDEALAGYDRALAIGPDDPEALNGRGIVLRQLRRPNDALASYDRALSLRPDYPAALANRGNVLTDLKRFDEALASFDRALAIRPDFAGAMRNRSNVLREMGRLDEALASCDRALAIQPDFAEALVGRGALLLDLGRLEEALASCDRALAIRPDYAEALNIRGVVLHGLGRLDAALASFARALAIRPDYADAHWSEALCRLLAGDFAAGWAKYEWRWRTRLHADAGQTFAQPPWLGEPEVAGKTVLLHAEQGFGDTIQFCRYATLLAERGARVVLQVQPELKSLLVALAGVHVVLARGEPLPDFDFHCPLLSLPLAFGTTLGTIPSRIPYLAPRPAPVERWRARLAAARPPRIGIAWSGNAQHRNDRHRSIGLGLFARLLYVGGTLVSLQKELRDGDRQWLAAHPEVLHAGDDLSDFADTAVLISLLDVVISVDTVVAHLAGAMGKPVWILLPALGVDWRWLLGREDSPWYPSARLFRQPAVGDWDSVMERVASELRLRFGAA